MLFPDFHRVSLICSADNIFMRKVIIIHYIYCISDIFRDFGRYRLYLKSLVLVTREAPHAVPMMGTERPKTVQFTRCLHAPQKGAISPKPLFPVVVMRMPEIFLLQIKCRVAKVCKNRCPAVDLSNFLS